MARIENTISLRDSCSGTLDRIARRMAGLTNSMYRASSSLDHLGFRMSGFGNLMRSTFGQFTLANIASNAIINLVDRIREIPGAIAQASDSFMQMESRLGLVADKFGANTESMLNKVYQSTIRARGGFEDTMSTISRLGLTTGDTFKSTDELVQFAETMNKAFAITGTTGAEKSGALLQMAQGLGSGLLQGDELRSLRENAPMICQKIAEYMKVPTGALKDLGAEGEITADIVKNAVLNATNEINHNFNKMPRTWEQNMQMIKNAGTMAFKGVYEQINKIANSEAVQKLTDNIIDGMETAGQVIAGMINEVRYLGGVFAKYKDFVIPVVSAFSAALVVANGQLLINAGRLALAAANGVLHAAASAMETASIIALTFAQEGLNAALALCPITWILYGIIALVGAFYLAVAAVNHFAGTSFSATGIIFGAFAMLGAAIWNIVAYIYNIFAIAFEGIINSGKNSAYAVKKYYANMAMLFLNFCISMTKGWDNFATSMANAVIQAVNIAIRAWNKFVSILPEKIRTKLEIGTGGISGNAISKISSITGTLENYKKRVNDWVGKEPEDYINIKKAPIIPLGDAYKFGYQKGASLFGGNGKKGGGQDGDKKGQRGAPFDGNGGSGKGKDKGVRVNGGHLDDNQQVKIAEESMKILLDLARREVQLNYQQITPQVNVTFGDVHETANVDKVLSAVEQKIVDIYESNLH